MHVSMRSSVLAGVLCELSMDNCLYIPSPGYVFMFSLAHVHVVVARNGTFGSHDKWTTVFRMGGVRAMRVTFELCG
jgi:hypothetical protein